MFSEDMSPLTNTAPQPDDADQPEMSGRWQFSLRDMLMTTTVIALYMAAYVAAFRHVGAEPRRFILALPAVLGAFVGIAVNMLYARRQRGPALYRLRMKRSRFEVAWLCAMPLGTLLFAALADRWLDGKTREVLLVGILAGITIGAIFFVLNVTAPHLCLSAAGVAVGRLAFLPWRRVSSARWLPGNVLEIKVNYGLTTWRGIAAPAGRVAIDAFLRDKLVERLQPLEA